jgi:hypothetical protein
MDTNAMRTLMDTAAMQILRERFAGRGRVIAAVVVVAWVIAAIAGVVAVSATGKGTPKASPSSASPARTHASATGPATPRATPGSPGKKLPPAVVLQVASVQAFGPSGTSDGDNPDEAASVISGATSRPWHTKWYATAHFGMLQRGTGLLLDMGSTRVTVTKITLNLAAGSVDVIIRAGNEPVPGALTEIAHGTVAGGTVSLPVARMASARYVEIWFASLPQNAQGTYEESVYGVEVTGRA